MTDLTAQNVSFYWATLFLRQLSKEGVCHAVISPGSRSTPLTLAAAAHPSIEKHVILDERSAAFTALGVGKSTGNPAVLICTSGTALANYYPAVIEARQSGVPLLLATADRPPHLRSTGANQAIDQLKIFGDYPVFFHEVGEPNLQENDLNRLEMLASQAVYAAKYQRGPAHLNFPFRKPLEPTPDFVRTIAKENEQLDGAAIEEKRSFFGLPTDLIQTITSARRPLILLGPLAPLDDTTSIARLADQIGAPILSESSIKSPNVIQGFSGFLRGSQTVEKLEPDLILRFGFQPTAKALEQALSAWQPDAHFHFACTHDWQDATFSGCDHIPWLGQPFAVDELTTDTSEEWLIHWRRKEKGFQTYFKKSIQAADSLTDGHIYRHLLPQCPADYFVMASNSFPARDIHLFGATVDRHPLFLNRGASGIDGITSTAIGLSLGLQKPGLLFTGDLAFFHDTNALLNHKKVRHNLTVIVINNAGGSIFRMLPIQHHDNYFEDYFETPQSADIEALVQSYDIPYHQIDTLQSLKHFDLSDWQQRHHGLSVIECRTDADASMELRKKVWNFD